MQFMQIFTWIFIGWMWGRWLQSIFHFTKPHREVLGVKKQEQGANNRNYSDTFRWSEAKQKIVSEFLFKITIKNMKRFFFVVAEIRYKSNLKALIRVHNWNIAGYYASLIHRKPFRFHVITKLFPASNKIME